MLDPIRLPLVLDDLMIRVLRAFMAIHGGPSIPALYSERAKTLGAARINRRLAYREAAIDHFEGLNARLGVA